MNSSTSVLDTNTIVEKYGSLVSSICRRMIQNAEDAKDAAQEAWAEIIKGLPSFKGESKLSTWIYTVTYHSVMHFCQKDKIYSTKFLRDYFHG
ncbi:MAG TPA: sigma-70 family RNA polymerase sigma factor, partial [Bacillota bacterium]|nr:sigma-70 family RNA polymerase sigma factor [Bacillota bacterium]